MRRLGRNDVLSAMPYTLWHCGVLIGTTEFEGEDGDAPKLDASRHLAGAFHPTDYGRQLLPRVCGMLTAAADLKEELVLRGLNADDAPPELMEHLFENTAAGAHILDIGRVLCDVELRAPSGCRLEVASIGFMELAELAKLSRRHGRGDTSGVGRERSEVPEFLVSATFRELIS
jgi:hypothetical protein